MDEIDFKAFLNILAEARLEAMILTEFNSIVDEVCTHEPKSCVFCLHKKVK